MRFACVCVHGQHQMVHRRQVSTTVRCCFNGCAVNGAPLSYFTFICVCACIPVRVCVCAHVNQLGLWRA